MSEAPNGTPPLHPWLAEPWQGLLRTHRQQRLPHALLLSGVAGVGKWDFARLLAESLLCPTPQDNGQRCGQCPSCRLSAAGTQPDLLYVEPEEAGKVIRIDQIRELCAELALKSHGGGYKVALIRPADRMNVNAANSLLKTLEEPTDNTLLILVTERPAQLPATIRSRCQQLVLVPPARADAVAWLSAQTGVDDRQAELLLGLAAGAPLAARRLGEGDVLAARHERLTQLEAVHNGRSDPLAVAADWNKEDDLATLVWMQGWISDMIRLSMGGETIAVRNEDLRQRLGLMAQARAAATLYRRLDQVTAALRMGSAGGINRQLMMEDVLVPWAPGAET